MTSIPARIALGIGAWQIIGSYETVAERIRELNEVGIESILMCFFDPLGGLHHMEDEILPILKRIELRKEGKWGQSKLFRRTTETGAWKRIHLPKESINSNQYGENQWAMLISIKPSTRMVYA